MANHNNDIVLFNTWFDDTSSNIIKEEGEGGYNQVYPQKFQVYLTCNDVESNKLVQHEKRPLMQLKTGDNYGYAELMKLGRLAYVNLVDNGMWKGEGKLTAQKFMITDDPNKFIALAAQIMKTQR